MRRLPLARRALRRRNSLSLLGLRQKRTKGDCPSGKSRSDSGPKARPSTRHRRRRARPTLVRAAREAWGIVVESPHPDTGPNGKLSAYMLDDDIEARLRARSITFPTKAPKPSKPSRSKLSAKLVEKRTLHAVAMMNRAEKRAKSAQRTLTKWREKVRYYERKAARR